MIAYSPSRQLSQVLDSQGDGTGTINQVFAAKSITGATNATPIVVTSSSHGYSDGDFVNITGVVGNTACNDLHIVANKTANTFELTTPAGADVAGNGSYSSAGAIHLSFVCKPAAGETFCLHMLNGYFIDATATHNEYMDETALSVGIKVQVRQNTTVVHTISPQPIKTAPVGWSLGADQGSFNEGISGEVYQFVWSFEDCIVSMTGDANEFFVILNSDAIAIEQQVMSVHGESI